MWRALSLAVDLSTIRFAAPGFLVLLVVPAGLGALWIWQLWRRRRDLRRMRRHRRTPVRERLPQLGDLAFWLCLLVALSLVIVALARPVAVISTIESAGIDLVILQDGSASMRVRDVGGDRWQRSMRFLRTLGESLRWDDDRVALALFANIATPQVRLTRDPNTFFFFLDHLEDESPFRVQDDTTWDTNIERGIYWGLRLIQRDEEVARANAKAGAASGGPGAGNDVRIADAGSRANSRAFVLVSDGQAWSGEVEKSIRLAQEHGVPIFVVGVGTTAGGIIPEPDRDPTRAVLTASLDRSSLAAIATAGGGRYFELGREDDRDIANAIIESTRRRAAAGGMHETTEDLYWRLFVPAAMLVGLGVLFLRDRTALVLQLIAAAGVLVLLIAVAK